MQHKLIGSLRNLSHISSQLRSLDFSSIGILNNEASKIHDLTFTPSGRPIPPEIREARQAYREALREFCMWDRMVDPTCEMITKELEDATNRGEDWIDPRYFVGLISISRDRRRLATNASKIRNAIIQEGWSIEDQSEGV